MDGTERRQSSQVIVEMREMRHHEDNALKEASLKSIKHSCKKLQLWIHDLACRANFADGLVKHRMLDKFHAKVHTTESCRKTYNPNLKVNKALLKKHRVTNTSICEQVWTFMNKHVGARTMKRENYRAYWRHLCIHYNKAARGGRRVLLSSKPTKQAG